MYPDFKAKLIINTNILYMMRKIRKDVPNWQELVKEKYIIKAYFDKNNIEYNTDVRLTKGYALMIYLSCKYDFFRPNYYDQRLKGNKWAKLRKEVFAKYGYKCMKCGYENISNHVDHIKPVSLFPDLAFEFDNLQVLCASCNTKKSNKFIVDYRECQD